LGSFSGQACPSVRSPSIRTIPCVYEIGAQLIDYNCRYTGLALLDAGSDTTGAVLLSFVLVLAAYPEIQERARKEIDAIVGGGRLPVFEDFPQLPFLNALIKETLRFKPQFPMGIPHLMADDAIVCFVLSDSTPR
jgi:cytochrome P450